MLSRYYKYEIISEQGKNQGKVLLSSSCFHAEGCKAAALDPSIQRQFQTHGSKSSRLGWALANQPRKTLACLLLKTLLQWQLLALWRVLRVRRSFNQKGWQGKIKKLGSSVRSHPGAHLLVLFLNTSSRCPPWKPIFPKPSLLLISSEPPGSKAAQPKGFPGVADSCAGRLTPILPRSTPWLGWGSMFLLGELHTVTLTARHGNL